MNSFLDKVNSEFASDLENTKENAYNLLQEKILKASRLGQSYIKINNILGNNPSWRSAIFDARQRLSKEGFKLSSSYVGRAGSYDNYGEYYVYFVSW